MELAHIQKMQDDLQTKHIIMFSTNKTMGYDGIWINHIFITA